MAYSNLGINLLATGSEAGNWGNITNDNFNLFDSAIVGADTLTLTTTSTTGLNVADGAASTGRNRIVTISSTGDIGGTGNVQITPADFVGYYFIRNSLASNRSVIISQGTGATTVTVENGKDVIVRCDGANNVSLVLANPAFTSVKTDSLTSKTGTFTNSTEAVSGVSATTTNASTTVTLGAANPSILVGMRVTGSNIPANTSVISNSGTTLVISNAATGSGATTLAFFTIAPVVTDTLAVYGQVTNALSMGGNKITNLGTPTATTDATTKTYVDTAITAATAANPRNSIINGAMQIAQRGTSTASAPSGTFITDRFTWQQSGVGEVNVSRSSVSGAASTAGLKYSARIDVAVADTSIGASDIYFIGYAMEGYDAYKFRDNTFTLSFWVRAPGPNTVYSIAFRDPTLAYSYVTTFTVIADDTWEYKTITVTGGLPSAYFPTGGFANGVGVYISWCLAAGSTYNTSNLANFGAGGANKIKANTQTYNVLVDATNNFYLTGVQMELGDTATNFDFNPYGTDLALCQRYYETGSYYEILPISNSSVVASYYTNVNFSVTKRDVPNMTGSTNNQGTVSTPSITNTNVGIGRSNVVADRQNTGTYVADAEF